jgi:hypothetical protein
MKVYLITDEQIEGLYASGTAGSRNFERVIEGVQRQDVTVAEVIQLLILKRNETKTKDDRGTPGDQPA